MATMGIYGPIAYKGELAMPASGPSFQSERLMTPQEVAAAFRVDPKTVTRWAKQKKLTSIRTLGGHRRYRESQVKGLLESLQEN